MTANRSETERAERWLRSQLGSGDSAISFSFSFDGRDIRTLVPGWTRTQQERRVDTESVEQVVTWTDPATGLQVSWTARQFRDFPAVETVLRLRNTGSTDTPLIADVQAMDTLHALGKGPCTLRYSRGARTSLSDFEPLARVLGTPQSAIRLAAGGGRSSSDYLPFFNVDAGAEGVVVGIGWSGEWAARFTRQGDALRIEAGMDRTRFLLHPGEEVRSPMVLLLSWEGDHPRGNNLLRSFILRHHAPQVGGRPLSLPVLCPSWGSTPAAVHQENIRTMSAHGLPVDCYWIDAEWFGATPWWKNVGTWTVRGDAYPHGMRPISDQLHAAGSRLLVWFEPHRVARDSAWAREHPEWLLRIGREEERWSWPHWVDMDDPRWQEDETHRSQIAEGDALLDIGNPAARRFLAEAVSRLIEECGIDCYREDFNIAPLAFWRKADAPDRQGITEMKWVEGLYAFWDELRERHPGLLIDNCASGGRRIDLETLGRATPFWRTDYPADALAQQCHALGIMRWIPLSATGRALLDRDDPYQLRSAMSSSLLAFFDEAGDGPRAEPFSDRIPFDTARRLLEGYREIQPFFYGDFYPLTEHSTSKDAWMAYQLDRPESGDGLVMAFRRPASPFATAVLQLHGIDASAAYEVTDTDRAAVMTVQGSTLREEGLAVHLARRPQSALIRYRRAGR